MFGDLIGIVFGEWTSPKDPRARLVEGKVITLLEVAVFAGGIEPSDKGELAELVVDLVGFGLFAASVHGDHCGTGLALCALLAAVSDSDDSVCLLLCHCLCFSRLIPDLAWYVAFLSSAT